MTEMLSVMDLFALTAVMVIGLPHGAFDGAIAFFLGYGRSRARMTGFLVMYLFLAGLYALFWSMLPVFGLAAFLAMTVLHFGSGDIQHLAPVWTGRAGQLLKTCQIIVHGGLVTIVLPYFHPDEVMQLFIILAGPGAAMLMDAVYPALLVWLAAAAVYLLAGLGGPAKRAYSMAAAELAGLVLVIWTLPPLAGFALYFCVVHSRRHFASIWTTMQSRISRRLIIISGAVLTGLSWAMGAGLYFSQTLGGEFTADEAFVRTVFILLAALTVPHMVLVDTLYRPKTKKMAQI